jgi:hypothetical protein
MLFFSRICFKIGKKLGFCLLNKRQILRLSLNKALYVVKAVKSQFDIIPPLEMGNEGK